MPGFRSVAAAVSTLLLGLFAAPATPAPVGPVRAVLTVEGHPLAVIASPDGTTLYVSVAPAAPGARTGIAIFHATAAALTPTAFVPLPARAITALALTPDGKTLLVAHTEGLTALDAHAAAAGTATPYTLIAKTAIADLTISRDGHHAFATDPKHHRIITLDLRSTPARTETIALPGTPTGLALHDNLLYVPLATHPTAKNDCTAKPQGTLAVIDTKTHRLIARTPTCTPGPIIISEDGSSAWLALTKEDAVVSFNTSALRKGNAPQTASLQTGRPITAMALLDADTALVVAESNRFNPTATTPTATVFTTREAAPHVLNGFALETGPHKITLSRDRRTLYVTNAGTNTITAVDAAHLTQPGE